MIFVPPFGGYNKKIFRLASLAVICTPHLCKRYAAPGPLQATLIKVLTLLCLQANSAYYPQREAKWVVAYLLWATG